MENPHGIGTGVLALAYHPRNDVAVTAAQDGAFNLWGVKRNASTVETLAATARGGAEGGGGKARAGAEEDVPKTHWACTLSVSIVGLISCHCVQGGFRVRGACIVRATAGATYGVACVG